MYGEDRVRQFFIEHFDGWEIYCQPHVNGKIPDFALLNPKIGLGIFEVKEWDLTAGDWRVFRSSILQAQGYKKLFRSIFAARHNCMLEFPVTVGLIFTRASNGEVDRHFQEYLDGSPHTTLAGSEALEAGDAERIFPLAFRRTAFQLTEDAANDLRSWLIEPHHFLEHRQPFDDDPRQRRFVNNTDRVKLRRMRGAAGSGKSVTLVRRAAKIAAEGKDVLFVFYNNALINYLRDTCDRTGEAASSQIKWRTFHSHCGHIFSQARLSQKFDELKKDQNNWEEYLPSYILNNIDYDFRLYDAIYVDEGQDFNLSWWRVLRRSLRNEGEMMIAFDSAQQIYPRTDWNTETLSGAGFRGSWIELGGGRRRPNCLLPVLRSFSAQFHPKALDSLPDKIAGADHPCEIRWVQETRERRVTACVRELARIIQRDGIPVSRAITDLTLLCDRKENCLEAERQLAAFGLISINTVKMDEGDSRDARKNFTMRTPRIKISTIQSYKGWQSRLIVVSLSKFAGLEDAAVVYTALTRIKTHPSGSNLTVVCSVPKLQQFGSAFPDFDSRV